MARINTIENDLILDLADKLAGSRSEDGRTRNYPLSSIASLLARTGSANTLGVTLAWKPAVDRTDIMDGEYIVTQDELLNLTSVTVSATTLNGVQVLEILQEFVGGEVKITAAKDSGYRFFAIDSPQTLVTTADGTITIAITDLGRGQNNVTLNESNLGITSLGARGARGHSISNITSSKVGTTTTITIIYADGTQQETFELEDGVDGDSAYEVWLAEGNTGSTMDFLTSLVGAQGFQGKYFESIYTSSTSNPGIPAPSTDYDIDAGTFTPPTTWSSAVPNRGSDESIYEARANVDPAGISTTLVWMSPIGYSGVGMVASEGYFTTLATAAGLGETDPDAERQVITTNEVYNDLRAAAALDPTLLATLQRVTFDIIDDPRASATSSLTGNLDITGEYRRNGVAISAAVGFGSDGGEVATWAEGDDTTTIPTTKIPNLSTSKITGFDDAVDARISTIGDLVEYSSAATFTTAISLGTTTWNQGDVAYFTDSNTAYFFNGTDGATTGVTLADDFLIISSTATLASLGITSSASELNNLLSISNVSEEAIPLKRSNALVNSGIVITPGVTSTTDRVGTGANLLSIPVSLITFGGTSFAILASAVSTLTQGQVYEFRDSSDASVAGFYTLTSVLGGLATFTYISGSNTSALLAIGAGGILETRATAFVTSTPTVSVGTTSDTLNLTVTGDLVADNLPTSYAPVNAEQNVQPDYTATTGDARILNKPTLGNLAAQDLADIAVATTQVTGLTAFVDGRITAIGDIETYADEAAFTTAIAAGTTIWNKGDVAILASPSSAYLFTGTDGATTGVTLANDFSIISSAASLASLGITVSATEINLLDGASSNIQDQLDLTNPSTRGAVFPSSPSFGDEFYLNDTIVGVVPYGTAVFFENYANAGGTAAGAVFITQSAANYNVQISAERDAVVPALGVDSAPVTVYSRVDSSSPWVLLGPTIDSAINGSQNRIRFSTNLAIALLNAIQPGYELGYQSTSTPEGWYKFVDNAWTAISPGGTSALPVTVAMTTNLADGSIPFNSSGSLEDSGLDVTLGTTSTTEREGTGNAIAIIQPADITPTTGTTFDTTSTVTAVLGVGSFYEFGSNNIYEYTSTTFGTATFTRVSGTTPFGLSVMVGGINIRATAFVANKGVLAIGSTTGSNSDRLDIELSGDITNGLTIGKSDGITNINGSESLIFKGLNDIENGQIQIIGGSNSALQIFTGSVGVLTSAMVVQVNNTAIPGNLNLSDTGGIRFGTTSTTTATGSASTSKTLDDYEEGTWTATGPQSSTTTTGIYTKIGNQVTLQARISGLDYGASTGTTFTAAVSGLPFAPVASTLGIARLSNSVGTEIDTDIIRVIRLANIISLTSIQGGSGIEAIDLIITYTTTA